VKKDVLFEIGTEELPATNLADIFETAAADKADTMLAARLKKALEEKRISFAACRAWATPRRLVFYAGDVSPRQAALETKTKVLPREEAYSADGKATDKFLLILERRGASLKDTETADWNGKPYVFIKKTEPALATEAVLPEVLKALVKSLSFPKNMKWGERWEDGSDIHFPRPIRNFLCFYGEKKISFAIGKMRVSHRTVIFSKGRRKALPVKSIAAYFKALKAHGVILDPVERKKAIQKILGKLTAGFHGRLYDDPFLLSEVAFLVETPDGLSAPFHEEFLKLPLEVLTVSMARKQRIFGVLGKEGRVLPRFLAILDGRMDAADKKVISKNIENILHAKLQDSLFFYKEDTKIRLEKKREELKDLVFLKGAGSMLEKSDRLAGLARKFNGPLGLAGAEKAALERAAFLSKADLLTQMVGEFPELQGIMGKYYALENGESREAAAAIGEQYLPRTAQDKLPESLPGSLLSILDKTDLITACFILGNEPSSSLDPYGLRRSATAVIKIAVDKKISFSLLDLLAADLKELGRAAPKEKEEAVTKKLILFFKDRFKALAADRGFREDLAEAALASRFENIYETYGRVALLSGIFKESHFTQAWKVVERTANILKGNKDTLPMAVDAALFTEDLERRVFASFEQSKDSIEKAKLASDYKLATSLYAEAFFAILGEFFEKVFVNVEDLNVRKNRFILLRSIKELYTDKIADLSVIKNI